MALETRIERLEEALGRLAEAQARTEARVGRLEEAVTKLAEAQARTEATLQETQRAVQQLTRYVGDLSKTLQATQRALQRLSRQVGGLSDRLGGDLEDIAYIVLYDVLAREFGWEVGVLERTWQRWDGEAEEVNIFGRARDPAHPERSMWIVGEAKHNPTLREVDRFAQQVARARRHLQGEVFAVCFAYRARPVVRDRLKALGIPLLFSYGRFA